MKEKQSMIAMMEVEYKKDLRHNYMVIEENAQQKAEPYCIKLLQQQEIEGMLPVELRCMDNKALFYYEITSKQSMANLLEKTKLNLNKLKSLCISIIRTVEQAYEYLLPEDDFILAPEYIYLDINKNEPSLCFLHGYGKCIKDQMTSLLEYLMNKVDYNDKEAVVLVYQLYAVCKEEGYTFSHLLEVLQNNDNSMQRLASKPGVNSPSINNTNANSASVNSPGIKSSGINCSSINSSDINSLVINSFGKVSTGKNSSCTNSSVMKKAITFNRATDLKKENKTEVSGADISTSDNSAADISDADIPVMMEKIEGEAEVTCYPLQTYLYAGACIIGGVLVIIICFASGILYNSFGNRIDYSKLFALALIIFCSEGYLLNKMLDKKNRITKMVKTYEYIDPRQELGRSKVSLERKILNKSAGIFTQISAAQIENSSCQWESEDNTNIKHSKVDSDQLMPIIRHTDVKQTAIRQIDTRETDVRQTDTRQTDIRKAATRQTDITAEETLEDEDYNPTCLLNATAVKKEELVLKAFDKDNYKDIPITEFPFFIGKLRKNVDFCLENDVVSRYHAKITREEEHFFLTDLNSTNGTFVNEEALQTYQKKEIILGDEIAFANIKYQFIKQ